LACRVHLFVSLRVQGSERDPKDVNRNVNNTSAAAAAGRIQGSKDGVGNKDADGLDCLAWLPAEAKTVAVKQKGKAQRSVGKVWGK